MSYELKYCNKCGKIESGIFSGNAELLVCFCDKTYQPNPAPQVKSKKI